MQVLGGVAAVEPGIQDAQHLRQAPGIAVAVPVHQAEGHGIVAALQPGPVQAGAQDILRRAADGLPDLGNLFLPGVPHLPAEPGLLHSVAQGDLHVRAQPGVQDRPLQGGLGVARQVVGQQGGGVQLHRVIEPAQELAEGDDGLVPAGLPRRDLVADARLAEGQGLLDGDGEFHHLPVIGAEHPVQQGQAVL